MLGRVTRRGGRGRARRPGAPAGRRVAPRAARRSRALGLACALAVVVAACSGESPAGLVAPPAAPPLAPDASLAVTDGDAQVGPPGAALPAAPTVRVTDAAGGGVTGLAVSFTVLSGGGSVSEPGGVTDGAGRASAGSWTLGDREGTQELRASVEGIGSVVFRATARPAIPAELTALRGDGQSATIGTAVPVRPAVTVRDSQSAPLEGVTVTFAVVDGGGSVFGGVVTTNASGVAEPAAWTLGGRTGSNRLEVTVPGLPPLEFEATAMAGPPADVAAVEGDGQSAAAGSQVPARPAVRVVDVGGNPVPGAAVTFTATAGGGHVGGATATTDSNGRASVGSWTLGGSAGMNALEARVAGTGISGNPVTFSATATTAGGGSGGGSGSGGSGGGGYHIQIRFNAGSTPTGTQRDAFDEAGRRWEDVVTGDLPAMTVDRPAGTCTSTAPIDETIDDLVIFVTLEAIDGPGGVLGTAGPCMVRNGSTLPVAGAMTFDTADLASIESNGLLGEVILHEMGHVLGIGTLWKTFGLLADPAASGGTDPHFTGAGGLAAFDAMGGSAYGGQKVPVENTGSAGTRDGHWRETVFDRELMTGWVDAGHNPLGQVTIASLADLGYAVDMGEAESVGVVVSPSVVPRAGAGPLAIHLTDDVWRGTIEIVGPSGRPVGVIPN